MATEEMKALPMSSSREPKLPPEQCALYYGVLHALDRSAIPYCISGAFGMHAYTGIWRDTKDLDVFMPAGNLIEALRVLKEEGWQTSIADDVWIAKVWSEGYFVDIISGMNNAAVTVEMSWIERSRPHHVLGHPVRVIAPEELLVSKVFVARRERFDGADICHLIYCTKGELDWDRVMWLLTEHGDHSLMLLWHLVLYAYIYPANIDLVPHRIWKRLIDALIEQVENPDTEALFRGTLLDENMFNIDVAEWGLADVISGLREARHPKIPPSAANPPGGPASEDEAVTTNGCAAA